MGYGINLCDDVAEIHCGGRGGYDDCIQDERLRYILKCESEMSLVKLFPKLRIPLVLLSL